MSEKYIDFLGYKYIAITFSVLLVAFSVYQWIATGSSKYGIDFVGGTEVVARFGQASSVKELSNIVEQAGLKEVAVQSFEFGSNEFSVRAGEQAGLDHKALADKITNALKSAFPGKVSPGKVSPDKVEILKVDSVGATISDEVKKSALIAVSIGILGLLVYIAFRFEIAFGLGAVVAVFHDVIISLGIYLALGHEINGSVIAAALTILGYSVNDTIVVFDRVREEMRKRKTDNLSDLMNQAMNFCLSRTIITSGLTLFSALALLVLGGGAIKDLSLFLVVGIIVGSYSTIFIASPVVLAWESWRNRSGRSVSKK